MRRTVVVLALLACASPVPAGAADAARPRLYLSWPGKAPAPARDPMLRPRLALTPAALVAPRASAPALRPALPASAPVAPSAPVPAAAPVQIASAPPSPERPRLYSLHREYGETPDRPQIPEPVFLAGPPVDLAEPPAQPPTAREARLRGIEDADPDASPSSAP
jgi:hypothetical protein